MKFLSDISVIFIFIFLSVISGFRFESGADYFNYENIYIYISDNEYNSIFEPLFYILYKVAPSYNWGNFFISFSTNIFFAIACIKISKSKFVFIFVYIFSEIYLTQFNILRQSMATPLLLLFVYYNWSNKNTKSLFFAILAVFSHYISIFLIVVYIVIKKIKINYFFMILSLSLIYLLSMLDFFSSLYKLVFFFIPEKYYGYLDMDLSEGRTFGFKFIADSFIYFLCIYFMRNNKSEKVRVVINIIYIGFVFSFIAISIPILFRLAYFFLFFKILLYAFLFEDGIIKNEINKIFMFVIIFVYYILIFTFNISGNIYNIFPYRFVI